MANCADINGRLTRDYFRRERRKCRDILKFNKQMVTQFRFRFHKSDVEKRFRSLFEEINESIFKILMIR